MKKVKSKTRTPKIVGAIVSLFQNQFQTKKYFCKYLQIGIITICSYLSIICNFKVSQIINSLQNQLSFKTFSTLRFKRTNWMSLKNLILVKDYKFNSPFRVVNKYCSFPLKAFVLHSCSVFIFSDHGVSRKLLQNVISDLFFK